MHLRKFAKNHHFPKKPTTSSRLNHCPRRNVEARALPIVWSQKPRADVGTPVRGNLMYDHHISFFRPRCPSRAPATGCNCRTAHTPYRLFLSCRWRGLRLVWALASGAFLNPRVRISYWLKRRVDRFAVRRLRLGRQRVCNAAGSCRDCQRQQKQKPRPRVKRPDVRCCLRLIVRKFIQATAEREKNARRKHQKCVEVEARKAGADREEYQAEADHDAPQTVLESQCKAP